ncbi:MAG TPA: 50S ribosomal protein L22 [Pyrinomonadaceae bacterium]|nr:50S ribosomal protein L22 [Pyrinomonadaceae bacterium]
MEARASAKYLRGSSQKARLVVDMIRGKNVNQALAILRFANKRAAAGIEKCMRSAIANANEKAEKANVAVDPDELWLKAAFVDRGPTKNRRRIRPAPQGRAFRQQRHFCHVTILLSSEKPGEKTESEGKSQPVLSRRAKRGGAAAAPRAKRVAGKTEVTSETKPTKAAASKGEKKTRKVASKLGKALRRKKSED